MKFNVSANSASPNAAPAAPSTVPSVPIPVYRELAAELQATRVMLEAINTKNQQLSHQNQQLRQEVERVVQLGLNLRHWVEAAPIAEPVKLTEMKPARPSPSPESTAEATAIAAKLRDSMLSNELFTEEGLPLSRPEAKPAKNLNGLWLTLTVLLIIVTAFGAGFLLMKPFLSNR
jgi:hypothetical protein